MNSEFIQVSRESYHLFLATEERVKAKDAAIAALSASLFQCEIERKENMDEIKRLTNKVAELESSCDCKAYQAEKVRAEQAEAERDRYREALERIAIALVDPQDDEYALVSLARAALDQARKP